ncbi:MAG TPA: sugar phosphate isomerase/epimerase family protein [Bryobacterales bacterium]|nr:sugar phosphate isomerase/epimerase family protein [Bryobacterales bacterium]
MTDWKMRRRDLLRTLAGGAAMARLARAARLTRGHVCFITDEVNRDLSTALQFAKEFGIRQVELRNVDGKYCFRHDPAKLKEIHALLQEHGIHVAVLSTPILKCILPGSTLKPGVEKQIKAAQKDLPVPDDQQVAQQMDYLHKAIDAARILDTDMLRIFSYWRVEDPAKERPRIVEGLSRVAEAAEKEKIRLCIENEPSCNIANCTEAMAVLDRLPSRYLGINWDIANGASTGETPYPDGFHLLDKKRIWHTHIKGFCVDADTKRHHTCAVGDGVLPYVEIFTALGKAGYAGALSMETHYSINGQREPASRRSMQGILKVIDQLA